MKNLIIILVMVSTISVFGTEPESYYFSKTIEGNFEEITLKVKEALKAEGFGIVTEIDMDKTLSEKLDDVDMRPYRILGACNPKFAYETLQHEENIGLFLPCKVLVKEINDTEIEVVMVNPSVLMQMLGNEKLMKVADEVTLRFQNALAAL